MEQISDSTLRFTIKYELMQVRQATYKALHNSTSETRSAALDAIVDRIAKRMATWEILVAAPSDNIFRDLSPTEREKHGLGPAR